MFIFRLLSILVLVMITATSLKGIIWLSEPWWSQLRGKKKVLTMTVEPLAIIEDGKNKKIESEILTYAVAGRLNQINKVLSTDLPLPKVLNKSYVLEGVIQPKYDIQPKVPNTINFKLQALEIDIGGLLNYLQSSLDASDKLHGTLTLGRDNNEIIIALETSDSKQIRGPWQLKSSKDKSLQEIIEEISHQIAFDTHKMFNPQLNDLTYRQFQSFIEGLRSYQEHVFISAELEGDTEAQAHLNNARKIFQQLADQSSQCSLVYSYLASILSITSNNSEVSEVINLLEKAIELDPSNSFAVNNIDEFRKIRDTQFTKISNRTLDQLRLQPVFQEWELSQISSGPHEVKIAVLSTGIDTSIKVLADKITNAKSFVADEEFEDNNGHGTSVAGLIAAIAPKAKIIPIKVLADSGSGSSSQIIEGIEYAINNQADIILAPLGSFSYREPEKRIYDSAKENNIIVIAAGGNNSSNNKPTYPAAYQSVLGVGATNVDGSRASFSDYGSWITLFSPGVNLQTLWPGGQAQQISGTSHAATIVAAVAALMKSYNPKLTPDELQNILKESSTKFIENQLNLNAQNAVKKAQESI